MREGERAGCIALLLAAHGTDVYGADCEVGWWCRHNGYFVDLFVRASNAVAIAMYQKVWRGRRGGTLSRGVLLQHLHCGVYDGARLPPQFGYSVYRRVIGYYSNEEDAYGEQSSLPRFLTRQFCAARHNCTT